MLSGQRAERAIHQLFGTATRFEPFRPANDQAPAPRT